MNSMAESPHYREALKAAQNGDLGTLDNEIDELSFEIGLQTESAKTYSLLSGLWFWTKKTKN
jgi:hypothetical protein